MSSGRPDAGPIAGRYGARRRELERSRQNRTRPGAGPAEAAGKNLPAAYGTVRHVEPVDLGSVQGLWLRRIADSPIRIDLEAGQGVHDGGVRLDASESFPPAAGESFVDAGEGLVWLASRPQYPLTVSCEAGAGTAAALFARRPQFRLLPLAALIVFDLWARRTLRQPVRVRRIARQRRSS